jgi:DNA-binding NtrC family response regulator
MSKILIIDDEPIPCRLLDKFLSMEGHSVRTGSTSEHAAGIAEDFQPDLLLTDWLLRDETGLEVANAVLDRSPRTKVVVVTGLLEYSLEHQLKRLSFGLLTKPLDLDNLNTVIQQTCSENSEAN